MRDQIMIFILLLGAIPGCGREVIAAGGINAVQISKLEKGVVVDSVLLKDARQIDAIVSIINHGERTPTKFIAAYRLDVSYEHLTVSILVCKQYFSLDGISYACNEDIENALGDLMKR